VEKWVAVAACLEAEVDGNCWSRRWKEPAASPIILMLGVANLSSAHGVKLADPFKT